jgi:hypothetical protein
MAVKALMSLRLTIIEGIDIYRTTQTDVNEMVRHA